MSLHTKANVGVIGSGISGLSFVYFLSKLRPDLKFTVFESSNRVGGYIDSQIHDFSNNQSVLLEKGPRTLRGKADGCVLIVDTLIKLGYKDEINAITNDSLANKKYLLDTNHKLIQVPNDFSSFRSFLRNPLGKGLISNVFMEIFRSPKKSNTDESVESFLTRRFGKNLPNNIVSAVFHGIYAADVAKLSAKTTMTKLVEAELNHGSIIKSAIKSIKSSKDKTEANKPELSPVLKDYELKFQPKDYTISDLIDKISKFPMILLKHGLGTLPMAIYKSLEENDNIKFVLNDPVVSVENKENGVLVKTKSGLAKEVDHLRSTINANEFGRILAAGDSSLKSVEFSKELTFIDIFLTNIYIDKNLLTETGFGYLIPKSNSNEEKILGVIFDSDIEKSAIQIFPNDILPNSVVKYEPKFNDDAKYTKLTVMMGGHFWLNKASLPNEEESLKLIKTALKRHLEIDLDGIPQQDMIINSTFIPQCLPQYNVGYEELSSNFKDSLNKEFQGKISLGGMSFCDGAGVPDCFANGFKDASKLAEINVHS